MKHIMQSKCLGRNFSNAVFAAKVYILQLCTQYLVWLYFAWVIDHKLHNHHLAIWRKGFPTDL